LAIRTEKSSSDPWTLPGLDWTAGQDGATIQQPEMGLDVLSMLIASVF
jgi:hypothetical protein